MLDCHGSWVASRWLFVISCAVAREDVNTILAAAQSCRQRQRAAAALSCISMCMPKGSGPSQCIDKTYHGLLYRHAVRAEGQLRPRLRLLMRRVDARHHRVGLPNLHRCWRGRHHRVPPVALSVSKILSDTLHKGGEASNC